MLNFFISEMKRKRGQLKYKHINHKDKFWKYRAHIYYLK